MKHSQHPSATLAVAALLLAGALGTAHAANAPFAGTWKAKPAPSLGGTLTMSVTAAPGGYHFVQTLHATGGGEMVMPMLLIPDGKPHTVTSTFGPSTATCQAPTAGTLECTISIAGSDSPTTFALAADGKTLTETSVSEEHHVSSSASTSIHETDNKATQGPSTSHTTSSTTTQTTVTVFSRQ